MTWLDFLENYGVIPNILYSFKMFQATLNVFVQMHVICCTLYLERQASCSTFPQKAVLVFRDAAMAALDSQSLGCHGLFEGDWQRHDV